MMCEIRCPPVRVRIIPGYDDNRLLTQGASSHRFGTTLKNEFLYWEPHDIAIIVTSANIGNRSSWMTVGSRTDRELLSQSYLLAGYAGSPGGSERQNTLNGTVTIVYGDRLSLSADILQAWRGDLFSSERI